MKSKLQKAMVLLSIALLATITTSSYAQGWLDKMKTKMLNKLSNKADSLVNRKTDVTIDKALNGNGADEKNSAGAATGNTGSGNAGSAKAKVKYKYSEMSDADFHQNAFTPLKDTNNTRFQIAGNLMLDVKGKYPNGYNPKWRFINYSSELDYDIADWVYPNAQMKHERVSIAIGDYKGKATLRFPAYMSCECYADIVIDSLAVITDKPQTFRITNFQKVLNGRTTGEPCRSNYSYWYLTGGWDGKITLVANEDGDIKMDMLLESYTSEYKPSYSKEAYPPQVYKAYSVKNIQIDNEMTAEKANGIIAEEKAAKQRQKDFMVKSQRQVDSLLKLIKTKYPGHDCYSCFSRTQGFGVKPQTTATRWSDGSVDYNTDYNGYTTVTLKNSCNQKITFIGITQLYDAEKGYYYKDVTKTMDANDGYQIQMGLMSYALTSLVGMNSDFTVQQEYSIGGASLNQVQWIRVIGGQKP